MDTIYCLIDGENIDATLGVNILKRFPRGEERPRWDRVLHFNPWAENADEDGADHHAHFVETADSASYSTSESTPNQDTQTSAHVTPAIFAHENHDVHCPNQNSEANSASQSNAADTTHDYSLNSLSEVSEMKAENLEVTESEEIDTHGLFFLNASQRVAKSFVQALLAIGWQPILLTSENPELKIVDMGIQKTIEAIVKEKPGAKVVIASHDVDYLPQIEMLLDSGHDVAVLCFREYLSISLAQLEERGLKIMDLEYDVDAFTIPLSRVSTIDIADYNPYDFI